MPGACDLVGREIEPGPRGEDPGGTRELSLRDRRDGGRLADVEMGAAIRLTVVIVRRFAVVAVRMPVFVPVLARTAVVERTWIKAEALPRRTQQEEERPQQGESALRQTSRHVIGSASPSGESHVWRAFRPPRSRSGLVPYP
jgi:hypothetical protein